MVKELDEMTPAELKAQADAILAAAAAAEAGDMAAEKRPRRPLRPPLS